MKAVPQPTASPGGFTATPARAALPVKVASPTLVSSTMALIMFET